MHAFTSLREAEAALAKYIPMVKEMTGKDITLDRIRVLMQAAGNPQDRLRVVHIAGTSGKTSTAYYAAALLRASGGKVGLSVSPHIDTIAERLQINGQPVSESEFCQSLSEFLAIVESIELEPSYFEILVAFAYWYFDKIGVAYAVMETGMGGLHDGTNIAQRPDKVCVITDIGLDHMHILGNTPEVIALQKAGIMHPGNVAFMYRQTESVTQVVVDYAAEQGAELRLQDQMELSRRFSADGLTDLPLYQQRNWLLARAVVDYVAGRDSWQIAEAAIRDSLAVQVPGRMDSRRIDDKTLVMDGAHNEQKIATFVQSFQRAYPQQRVPVLLALKQGKEYQAVLPLLHPVASHLIITTFDVLQDLPARSIDPDLLAAKAAEYDFVNIQVITDPVAAVEALLNLPGKVAIATGSFYLLSCIRPELSNIPDEQPEQDGQHDKD